MVEPIEHVDTKELVRRARSGDEDACLMLFDLFHDEIYRFATRRLGDPVAGQDVAADTMSAAFAGLGRYRWTGAPFEAWLYSIARRRVIDHQRASARRATHPVDDASPVADPAGAVVESLHVRAMVKSLPPVERDVIELRFMEGLDVDQTARRLGKKPGAIRVAQHRALRRLRDLGEARDV